MKMNNNNNLLNLLVKIINNYIYLFILFIINFYSNVFVNLEMLKVIFKCSVANASWNEIFQEDTTFGLLNGVEGNS